jgi:hypothetical protein
MRSGTGGFTAEDLVELGLRHLLFGEALPVQLGGMEFLTNCGVDREALAQALSLPEAVAAPIVRLALVEGLVGSGKADGLTGFAPGPRVAGRRRALVAWREPRVYVNQEPGLRQIEGFTVDAAATPAV